MLIAARRLVDDPRGTYRAISGLVLGLFVGTVAVAVITTFVEQRGRGGDGRSAAALVKEYIGGPDGDVGSVPSLGADLVPRLNAITGVRGVAIVHPLHPKERFGDGAVSCADLRRVGEVGRCPAGASRPGSRSASTRRRPVEDHLPAASVSPAALRGLPIQSVVVGTDGSTAAIESARTLLEADHPSPLAPTTLGELSPDAQRAVRLSAAGRDRRARRACPSPAAAWPPASWPDWPTADDRSACCG